ncbi:amino acid permease [Saitoella complicata NRRL Y-17804]|nr:amino acid permease [Saitoella complicata NRRL Y-17804]ODQ53272.1 amino acid permease [Saitoella complicata NRRL Y-17804]
MNPPTYEEAHLKRRLKGRHLQMIAIGGSIGTGLFVGSGSALANGGPAALLIDFSLIGLMLFCTVHALGELAVLFPIPGSFSIYSSRFLDPAWGFSMGWNYAMQWLVVLPLELTAAAITLEFWKGSANVNVAVWITIFLILIIVINLFGVRGYGEAEFVFSAIKVVAVIGFIILGVILNCGGGPRGGYVGGRYWRDPGAFSNGFKGVCSVFVTAAFSFAGTELVGLAAAETENPRKTLPRAVKQVFWRITLFYIISLLLVGMLVPYNNENLLGASGANASPFVIAITNAGINGLDSVMNVVIMISVLSVGNSSVYGSSRTLAALADNGLAPKIFSYVDREGRPLAGVLVSLILGCLAYINCSASGTVVFNWLVALSGLSNFFTWGSICAAHIMFRRAWKVQGYTVDQIPFRAALGTWGSWLGLIMNILCLIAQFYVALFPIGGSPDAESFFMSYLAFPIIIVTYLGWKIYKRPAFMTPRTIDLVTGRRDMDLDAIRREEELLNMNRSKLKRAYYWCC